MDQQLSPCYYSILTVTPYEVTPIGALHAEKIPEAILLYVFRITFPASPFRKCIEKLSIAYLSDVAIHKIKDYYEFSS